jgi:hypothetical protein
MFNLEKGGIANMLNHRKIYWSLLIIMIMEFCATASIQAPSNYKNSAASYFDEIKLVTAKYQKLWNKNIYGPLLLIDHKTMIMYANFPDRDHRLEKQGKIYVGQFPNVYDGPPIQILDWQEVMLPLPENTPDRISLLAYHLFQGAKTSLGFEPTRGNTRYEFLNQKSCRIYERLELEALKKALQSKSSRETEINLRNAFIFKKYRHLLIAGADTSENRFELDEGIAKYTGFIMSGQIGDDAINKLIDNINAFLAEPKFIWTIVHETIPAYGYLLNTRKRDWNKEITYTTDLTQYFIKAFGLAIPDNLQKSVETTMGEYSGRTIIEEENTREENYYKQIAEYKSKFIEQPHFCLQSVNPKLSYDYRELIPFEDKGYACPIMNASDRWGELTVTKGALMSGHGDTIILSRPISIDSDMVSGDGWTLKLNEDFTVRKDSTNGNYLLAPR